MKHFLLTLLLTFVVGISSAQTEHMKFKGIPMEGTLRTFTGQLRAKGFTTVATQDGISLLNGEFAGYKNCTICAVANKSGMVYKVSVSFPAMDKWEDLERCYLNYKSMLSEKYGEPKDCVEKFKNSFAKDDYIKMNELEMDGCKYYSIFSGNNGEIQLEITHQKHTCYVMLSYFDNANQEKLREQIMDDL